MPRQQLSAILLRFYVWKMRVFQLTQSWDVQHVRNAPVAHFHLRKALIPTFLHDLLQRLGHGSESMKGKHLHSLALRTRHEKKLIIKKPHRYGESWENNDCFLLPNAESRSVRLTRKSIRKHTLSLFGNVSSNCARPKQTESGPAADSCVF